MVVMATTWQGRCTHQSYTLGKKKKKRIQGGNMELDFPTQAALLYVGLGFEQLHF